MSSALFNQTVVLRRKVQGTEFDRYNRPIPVPPVDTPAPAWFEPRESHEVTDAAEQQISGYWLYLPFSWHHTLTASDSVILPYDLGEFVVQGELGLVPDGAVVEGYCTAALQRVTG